jgi:23S rRNA (uridine2479-2'-O)-methyltransferase
LAEAERPRRSRALRVSKRNALFQEWLALKHNRQKRHRTGLFLVEGTTAIDSAVRHGWSLDSLVFPAGRRLSDWAEGHLASTQAERLVEMDPELLAELTERNEGTELLALARCRSTRLEELAPSEPWLGVVVDRAKSPGNLGTVIRTATSFDAAFLVTTGHAADPFDPACVRASVGTLFDLPLVRLPSHAPLLSWVEAQRRLAPLAVVGTGQAGSHPVDQVDLRGNLLILLGNETEGLSSAYRDACDVFARLPTSARQPSLNVAAAAAIVLYEARRQRGPAAG